MVNSSFFVVIDSYCIMLQKYLFMALLNILIYNDIHPEYKQYCQQLGNEQLCDRLYEIRVYQIIIRNNVTREVTDSYCIMLQKYLYSFQFDLVCGNDYLNQLVMTIQMLGAFIGTSSSGIFSDRLRVYYILTVNLIVF